MTPEERAALRKKYELPASGQGLPPWKETILGLLDQVDLYDRQRADFRRWMHEAQGERDAAKADLREARVALLDFATVMEQLDVVYPGRRGIFVRNADALAKARER